MVGSVCGGGGGVTSGVGVRLETLHSAVRAELS